jgi:hypothetical protein
MRSACAAVSRWRGDAAARAAAHFELHLLAFLERLEAAHLDRGVMREQVFAALGRGDEAEALGVVEPLNGAGRHC